MNFSKNIISGFLVFLIALPLSLGIATASGFPPIGGVFTAIIGGMIAAHFGSAELTIKGPAAGLIVIALGAVNELGALGVDAFDPVLGYKRALAVGVVAAIVQIVFSFISIAKLARIIPISAVHGMLAAIGIIIIAKQVPVMCGVSAKGEPLKMIAEIPHYFATSNSLILSIALISVAILVVHPFIKPIKKLPAPLLVLFVSIPFAIMQGVDAKYLVKVPENMLDAIAFPNFDVITSGVAIKYIIMFSLVGTIESLLTVIAVDSLDPNKHISNLDKDLRAAGVGNLIAASIGGLPMISEVVRSKANIDAQATNRWSNFFHGAFLLLFVALFPNILQKIPLSALAAMLVVTGFRLASPKEFKHMLHIGKDQFAIFLGTCIVTLMTDLLVGVGFGILLQMILLLIKNQGFSHIFKPDFNAEETDSMFTLNISGPLVFSNFLLIQVMLMEMIERTNHKKGIMVNVTKVTLIDHTVQDVLDKLGQELDDSKLVFVGLEDLEASSHHVHATRWRKS